MSKPSKSADRGNLTEPTQEQPLIELVELFDPGVARDLVAGDFAAWLEDTQAGRPADVPCGTCNGCCKSFYFIHLEPDEIEALAHIPAQLLFPAPGRPAGHKVMGHDQFGHCPMLIDEHCSIYEHRPRTCRVYDCRIFAAANLPAGETDKALINERARRWQFATLHTESERQQRAVEAAGAFMRANQDAFTPGLVPSNPTQRALLVLRVAELFLDDARPGEWAEMDANWVAGRVAAIAAVIERTQQGSTLTPQSAR